ncbi:uncharacterized protein LOC109536973 [Dendroctonus ponderosae]|uniref:uncharacterized protein LOC109536973 n=1 Tax=Dendroctonus ponderosae TaxID=77166 RepID=UPI002035754A|nr:uncharacterized protein LOC109536973 [Dendroctonus ponderosae]
MKTVLTAFLGLLLSVQLGLVGSNRPLQHASRNRPTPTSGLLLPQNASDSGPQADVSKTALGGARKADQEMALSEQALVLDLDKIQQMSLLEYAGRRIGAWWDYVKNGAPQEPQSSFVGRCIGIAKKLRQIMPMVMIGGGIIITKLAFLVLFALKTIGLLGLLLLLNVGTVAAKLGAFLASKKGEHSSQPLHVHIQPGKDDEHVYSGLKGPPYGWDDRQDADIHSHELYNLYEKLKMESELRKYFSHNSRI